MCGFGIRRLTMIMLDQRWWSLRLAEWEQVFQALPRIDAILVPGGDPGNTRPKYLLPMLAKQSARLKHYHPNAQMWISAQGFSREWMDEFVGILQNEAPTWLSGVVYGPWCHMTIADFRRLIPAQYPIRSYPDITHSVDCQYPVPDWDMAFALTEGRETINPRPRDRGESSFSRWARMSSAFLPIQKAATMMSTNLSGVGWAGSHRCDVVEILRQYSRFFIGPTQSTILRVGCWRLNKTG